MFRTSPPSSTASVATTAATTAGASSPPGPATVKQAPHTAWQAVLIPNGNSSRCTVIRSRTDGRAGVPVTGAGRVIPAVP